MQAPIINPQIHNKPGYSAYDTGIADGVFIKDISGKPFMGQVSLCMHTSDHALPLVFNDHLS
jgi:hypothetical protein